MSTRDEYLADSAQVLEWLRANPGAPLPVTSRLRDSVVVETQGQALAWFAFLDDLGLWPSAHAGGDVWVVGRKGSRSFCISVPANLATREVSVTQPPLQPWLAQALGAEAL